MFKDNRRNNNSRGIFWIKFWKTWYQEWKINSSIKRSLKLFESLLLEWYIRYVHIEFLLFLVDVLSSTLKDEEITIIGSNNFYES